MDTDTISSFSITTEEEQDMRIAVLSMFLSDRRLSRENLLRLSEVQVSQPVITFILKSLKTVYSEILLTLLNNQIKRGTWRPSFLCKKLRKNVIKGLDKGEKK